ncbi:MAG TPA: DNA polymerase III subunit gamma/tau [Bacteroidota bacterium]|nr:DNA polymerase III subunit gamma/tau [Bacteroidota bacterium]
MAYIVTARKWRPLRFEDVVGQEHVTKTLKNAIAADRLSHAYIFSGPRGVGKTTTARILAKAVNCLHPVDANPDNKCAICEEITAGRSLNVIEIDGASNRSIDDIRNVREAVRYAPSSGKKKIYIIDEAHMLTKEAWNALLKTLEEPPPHILFIFATTELQKIQATILSRCQRFEFRRNTVDEIASHLLHIAGEEKIKLSPDAAALIGKKADGSMRDGQSIFDQIVAFSGDSVDADKVAEVLNVVDQELFFRATDAIKAKDSKACLLLVDEIIGKGYDVREFLQGLNEHFRNFLVAQATGNAKLIETSEPYKKRYEEEAKSFSENLLLRCINLVNETDLAVKFSQQPRFKLEIGMLLLIKLDETVNVTDILRQLEELKKKVDSAPRPDPNQQALFPASSPGRTDVRGSVKASPPSLRVSQIVSSPSLRESQNSSYAKSPTISLGTEPASPSSSHTPVLPQISLSFEEITARWPAFIEEARAQKAMVGAVLGESKLVDLSSNTVRLACPDDFHLDSLKRNRDFLLGLAQKVYGTRIRLEGFIGEGPAATEGTNSASGQPSASDTVLQHPVVQALVREFGAKQVDR